MVRVAVLRLLRSRADIREFSRQRNALRASPRCTLQAFCQPNRWKTLRPINNTITANGRNASGKTLLIAFTGGSTTGSSTGRTDRWKSSGNHVESAHAKTIQLYIPASSLSVTSTMTSLIRTICSDRTEDNTSGRMRHLSGIKLCRLNTSGLGRNAEL
mgnify:CR=1 FL=1